MTTLQSLLRTSALLCAAVLLLWPVAAQQTPTPSPAPSKTPTPSPSPSPIADVTAEVDTTEATEAPTARASGRSLPRSYTQEDLNVVVGNVQRPNGILWHDDYLWTACTGDWTLYRIADTSGETITFVGGVRNVHAMHAEPTEAGFDLFMPDYDTNALVVTTQNRSRPRTIASGLDGPWGIAELDDAHFLVTNLRGNNIVRINRDGETEQMMDGLRAPAGIVVDGDYGYVVNNGSASRAIEWFDTRDLPDAAAQPLVSGLQNPSGLVLAGDGYLYFTYALGTRGVVGRVNPDDCRDGGCGNDQVEIVLYTTLPAPLAGLTISDDMRLYVHAIFQPQIYWVQLYA